MIPRFRLWLKSIKIKYHAIINYCIEKPILSPHLFELIAELNRKILKIQRAFRKYNLVRKARMVALKKKFKSVSGTVLIHRATSINPKKNNIKDIPFIFIQELISDFYYEQLIKYLASQKKYSQKLIEANKEYEEYLKENILEVILHKKDLDIKPKYIPKPILKLYTDGKALADKFKHSITHMRNLVNLKIRKKKANLSSLRRIRSRTPNIY